MKYAVAPADLAPYIKIDFKLRKAYETGLAKLKALQKEKGSKAWLGKYTLISEMIEAKPALYLAASYPTEAHFFEKDVKESRQAVYRNLRVAKCATAADVERYGPTRLYAAIAYLEAKRGQPLKQAVDFDALRIELEVEGKPVARPLGFISKSELTEAVAHAVANRATQASQKSPLVSTLESAVKRSKVTGARVKVSRDWVTLRIPKSGLAALGRELATIVLSGDD